MSGISRRDLFRGRLFGRGDVPEPAPGNVAAAPVVAREIIADETNEEAVETPLVEARPVPVPPWERAAVAGEEEVASPVSQVATWELGAMDTTRTVPPANRRAQALGTPGFAPARRLEFSIQTNLCLAWRNVPCSVCRERCPVSGAIAIAEGRPTIVADTCTGCGDCVAVCPAPIMAIRMTAPRRAVGGPADGGGV